MPEMAYSVFQAIAVVMSIAIPLFAVAFVVYPIRRLFADKDIFGILYMSLIGLIMIGAAFVMSFEILSLAFGG
jgi:hypothetical protein